MSDATVFISYSRRNRDVVESWHDSLERLGLQVLWDKEEVPGNNWLEQIATWVEQSDVTLVVVSEASVCSPWVCNEILLAHRLNKRIIPIILEEPQKGGLRLLVDHLQWVDARAHEDPPAAIGDAIRVGLNLRRPTLPPLSELGPPRANGTARKRLTLTVQADPGETGEDQRRQFHTLLCDVSGIAKQELTVVHLVPEGDHVLLTVDLPATIADWLVACHKRNDRLTQMLNIAQITAQKSIKLLNDRYEVIVERLGSASGMGRVSKAIDTRLKVPVAVKRAIEGDPRLVRALEIEARVLAIPEMLHSSLPTVHDIFIDDETLYIVMTYIDGDDLEELLSRNPEGRFSLAEALPLARELLVVLDFLHTRPQPVLHRDIKPANIKLRRDGRLVLVDFGLARFEKTEIVGSSLYYAPPEQRAYKSTDERGDLFSLAATLHHLLTGTWPDEEVRAARRTPRDLNPAVPVQLDNLLMRAMAAEVERRPASARAMLEELDQIIASVFPKAETLLQRAVERQLQNDGDGAEQLLRQALDVDAQHVGARRRLCDLLVQQRRDGEALLELQKLYQVAPDEGRDPLLAALRRSAELLVHQRRHDEALAVCGEILGLAPDDSFAQQCLASIWTSKGDAARDAGEFDEAAAAYGFAGSGDKLAELEQIRRRLELNMALAMALDFEAEQNWSQARSLYERLARLDPGDPRWTAALERIDREERLHDHYNLGRQSMESGDLPRAKEQFKAVLLLRDDYKDVSELYAEVIRRLKSGAQ
jgi:tetratricopeptide (TPR) repeat protein